MESNKTVMLDGSVLNSIAKSSSTAGVVMRNLANRLRLRQSSDLERMKVLLIRKGEKIVEEEYRQLWKDLEEAGVGSIVYGRKGNPDRFVWHYSLKSIAKAAIENKDLEVNKLEQVTEAPQKKVHVAPPAPKKTVEHIIFIPLRKDYNLDLRIPSDITKDEVDTIQRALKIVSAS